MNWKLPSRYKERFNNLTSTQKQLVEAHAGNLHYKKVRDFQRSVYDHIYDWFALKKSIEEHGIIDPIVVTKLDNAVVDGNHRLAVAKLIYPPDKEIACVYEDKEFWEGYKDRFKSKYRLII